MNWADYQPGKRVVCLIDYAKHPETALFPELVRLPLPVPGTVCTITAQHVGQMHGGLCLSLAEFSMPWVSLWPLGLHAIGKPLFDAKYFRPVDEAKIDQFRKILTDIPTAVPA